MYEFLKKVFSNLSNIIFSGILLVLLLWAVITNIRLYSSTKHIQRLESELGLVRTELSNAQNRERELTETVGNIRNITERTDTILDQSGTTFQSIREKISILEDYFNSIHQYFGASNNDNNNNTDSKE